MTPARPPAPPGAADPAAAAFEDGRGQRSSGGAPASQAWLPVVIAGLALTATAMAVLAGGLSGAPAAGPAEVASLILLLVLAGFLGLEFRAGGHGNRVDLFDAALAAALVSLPGHVLLPCVVLAKAVALTVQRVPRDKTCFNLAQWGCAAAAGSLVLALLRDAGPLSYRDLLLLPVALLVVAAINAGSVLLVLVVVGGRPVLHAGPHSLLRGTVVGVLLNLALGAVCAALWSFGPASRPVVPLALLAVHLGTRLLAQQQAGGSRLAGLQRAAATMAGSDELSTATRRFLDELRRAFECAGVELRLRSGPSGRWMRCTSGYDPGAQRTAGLLDALLRRDAPVRLGPRHGDPDLLALLPTAGWRDCLASPVRYHGQVLGVLCTHDREGWEGFEQGELAVLEAAARVLGEAVHRDELTQVLQAERAALGASERRWRALASVLEQVARGTALPDTLALLARTVEEQTPRAWCAVLVRAPGQPPAVAAPTLPQAAAAGLEAVLLPASPEPAHRPEPGPAWAEDLTGPDAGSRDPHRRALTDAGVHLVQAWPLPCSTDGGAAGVLALCYPEGTPSPDDATLAEGAARVGGLAVDHVLVQHRLAHQAHHDTLTDLPNRRVFLDRLGQALRRTERGQTWALVLFLDLDRFKVVNDSLGHRAGDVLLCAVAERLRGAVRPGDTVARFGGDEFTMLCEGIHDEAHALRVVHRVQKALERPFPLGDSELFATSSIGIALGRGLSRAPDTLVEDADAAMYRAKDRGGNCFELFDSATRERAAQRLAISSALHRAVEREEFRVVYQPTVRLSTGEVEGVEALVRWERPGHGVVLPAEFVPLAEENGLIVPIGAFVLQEACRQARRWRDATSSGPPPTVSVNLSARQLLDPGLLPLVQDALQRSGVDPATISLEITESVLMGDVAASGSVLDELRGLGVRLFVDDFGTGYSSLTYLQRFPVDGVKVDRSFVTGLGSQADAAAIVRAVVGLAHGLGIVAVAEGVETQEQAAHLVDLECDIGQGYHFGRPGAADQVPVGAHGSPDPRSGPVGQDADRDTTAGWPSLARLTTPTPGGGR